MVLKGTSLVVESETVILRLSLSALEIGSEWDEESSSRMTSSESSRGTSLIIACLLRR